MDHAEKAKELFYEGYNCSQAVFCAFGDLLGMDRDAAARLSSSFGGGMGRLREVCGTVSGALMALGFLCGYSDPKDVGAKKEHYELIREFARRFSETHGSIVCRELLSGVAVKPGPEPEARTPEYYARRPCPMLAYDAARIADEMIKEYSERNKDKNGGIER